MSRGVYGRGVEQNDPKSWVDGDGQEWCYECKQQVLFFKEGWICSSTCPVYLASDPVEPAR